MILQAFRAFIKDALFLGTSKVTLPKLEFLTETVAGDAILGETVIIALGQKKTLKVQIELMNLEENIVRHDLSEEMRTSFLDFSMSVIISRAIPDLRDVTPLSRLPIPVFSEAAPPESFPIPA